MKVRELIEWLRSEDQDAEVHLAYNYGDHCRTTVAPRISRVEASFIRDSDYFRMPVVVEDNEDDEDGPQLDPNAVVLFAPGA